MQPDLHGEPITRDEILLGGYMATGGSPEYLEGKTTHMKHARTDYNRFGPDPALDDPSLLSEGSTPIGLDEPVFLLRAKDHNMLSMLKHYLALLQDDSTISPVMKNAVQNHIDATAAWQAKYGARSPDMPSAAYAGHSVSYTTAAEAAASMAAVDKALVDANADDQFDTLTNEEAQKRMKDATEHPEKLMLEDGLPVGFDGHRYDETPAQTASEAASTPSDPPQDPDPAQTPAQSPEQASTESINTTPAPKK